MDAVIARLKHNRPALSASSLRTYSSIIMNLYKKLNGTGDVTKFLGTNIPKIFDFLKDEAVNVRKTKLAVLISLFHDDYDLTKIRALMLEDANKYNQQLRSQEMTPKQKENWIGLDGVRKVYHELYKRNAPLLKKDRLTKREYKDCLDLILLSLYVLIPPRRSQDFSLMKIRNFEKNDNYYDGKAFHFNRYKTAKTYGEQIIKPTRKLKLLLDKWILHNTGDYILSTFDGLPLPVSKMTVYLNNIFGMRISTTMLRHIYISDEVLKNMPALSELDKVAEQMGHSVQEQIGTYKKID